MSCENGAIALYIEFGTYVGQLGQNSASKKAFQWQGNRHIIELLNTLSYRFSDPTLLFTALVHSSFYHENKRSWPHFVDGSGIPDELASNERLEFLGDAILDAIVASELMKRFPHLSEGQLSKLRGSIVNEQSLSEMAKFVNLSQCLLLGKGEIKSAGQLRDSLLADVFEAIVGALYLDSDFKNTYRVVTNFVGQFESQCGIELFDEARIAQFDTKTQFQEWCVKTLKQLPEYRELERGELDFLVALYIKGIKICERRDSSKKRAIKWLADWAIKNNSWQRQFLDGEGESD